jgi:phage tail sheath protein FI
MDDHTALPLPVYASGYTVAATGSYLGFEGVALDWETNNLGSTPGFEDEWTPTEAENTLLGAADDFKYTVEFRDETSLGVNDADRRTAIVTALQASINSNTDIRSDIYEYNLVLCPGYDEVVDELLNLVVDIAEEAMVIADTPMYQDPDAVVTWSATPDRRTSRNVAYYYPHGLASNLDGKNVMIAASGIALRTITYSDEVSAQWFAPAGTRRGLVSGVDQVGYYTGTAGSATTFVEVALNQGQRDNLYKYFTNINPIVFFPTRGLLVWGQKTSAPDASALDRINVARLVMYIRRQLRKNTMSFVFEPNDQLTRDNLKAMVDAFLGDLIVRRGLFDFATICDESNNTPDRIDRNEMYIDVALKPVRAAEFIYIPIRIVATGAEI